MGQTLLSELFGYVVTVGRNESKPLRLIFTGTRIRSFAAFRNIHDTRIKSLAEVVQCTATNGQVLPRVFGCRLQVSVLVCVH